ncbi:MAG: 1,4-alpha-glucan branching protein GlgB [Betaproteobacteria bacterium]|nr:1,4-alpha-glucan branching protein GlgB [Betaproteobacteria bacterium]
MIASRDIALLIEGRHPDAFAVLGPRPADAGGTRIRVWQPGAQRVSLLVPRCGGAALPLAKAHGAGLFEITVPEPLQAADYETETHWPDGTVQRSADAYAFGLLLPAQELAALQAGTLARPYLLLGAHLHSEHGVAGVRFAVWAPNAQSVGVVGDFNAWDVRRHPMRLRHEAGVWELFVPGVAAGALYKYAPVGPQGERLPLKADPYGFAAELRPATASRVSPLPPVRSLPSERPAANARTAPISIYEVHAPSWRRGGSGPFATWDELAEALPGYASEQGFTHVELMPIGEHPFDASWGYQPLGLYAPTARFGPPEGLARLVQACHARGIGVLLDWVPAHFPADAHGLARFDGTPLYEYADPREGVHRDWNTLIPNFARHEVRAYLAGNALYWLERHGVDGLRVDAVASMLYRDYSRAPGEWVPNAQGGRENLEAISLLRHLNELVGAQAPGTVTIAEESTAFPSVSAPTHAGGLGFHYKWNMGWMNDTLRYMREDPIHRRWHHDKVTFGLSYAFSENFVLPISHDEVVHGKGAMLAKMPGDTWQRFANLRAYYGFMWGHPGKKLLFMGQDFAQPDEWQHDGELPWHLRREPAHAGVQRLVRELNRLYRAHGALHRRDCDASGFEWLVRDDSEQSVLAWLRHGDAHDAPVLVVSNFTPVPRPGYRIGVPAGPTQWATLLDTDAAAYGGSGYAAAQQAVRAEPQAQHGRPASITVDLPPLATVFLGAVRT